MEDGVEHPILRAASFYKSLLSVEKESFCSTLIADRMSVAAGELLMETWGLFSPVGA